MESCQDLGSLIIVCTITYMCSTNSVFVCVEENKKRSARLFRPYADGLDVHGLIRKPTGILNRKKMDSVQWRISRRQPLEHSEQPF